MDRQFTALFQLSFSRLIDMEILASRADLAGLAARAGGILVALSFVLMYGMVTPYWFSHATAARIAPRMNNDEEFLLSLTIAAAGLLSVLAWNSLLPDRRDCLVLGTLPVSPWAIARARLAALLITIIGLVLLLNCLTGLSFPWAKAEGFGGGIRALAAWWITLTLAAIFTFAWMAAVQGVAALALPWNLFLRASGLLQLGALLTVLGLLFLTPPFSSTMRDPRGAEALLPSYWFTGFYHLIRGDASPTLRGLSLIAVRNVGGVIALAGVSLGLVWAGHMRKIVEAPDIAGSAGGGLGAWLVRTGLRLVMGRSLDQAVLLFTARTIARSRQHRLLLTIWAGGGIALAATLSRSLFNERHTQWSEPDAPLLVIGMLTMTAAILGTKAIFAIPINLPANWSFRIAEVEAPLLYFRAVRKALLLWAALPVWLIAAGVYLTMWPLVPALEALAILALLALLLADYTLYQFRKMPFTCGFLPASGQSFQTVRALAIGTGLLMAASAAAGIQIWAMANMQRFAGLTLVLGIVWWLRFRAWREAAEWQTNTLQFEEVPPAEIFALDLHGSI